MERLIGNIWFHDDGTGEVSVYERIGRRYLPIRAESEPLPDRIPFEAKQAIEAKVKEMLARRASLTPLATKLENLERQLEQFPNWLTLSEEEKQSLRDHLSAGMTDTPYVAPEPVGLPAVPTIEMQVEAANRAKQTEISDLAAQQTENQRLRDRLLALEDEKEARAKAEAEKLAAEAAANLLKTVSAVQEAARVVSDAEAENNRLRAQIAALEAQQKASGNGETKESQGQDAASAPGLLGQEARQEDGQKEEPDQDQS